jgi:hypothetical protein
LGVCRIDLDYFFILQTGVIPPAGSVEYILSIPREDTFLKMEAHLQAVTGEQLFPYADNAQFTNRQILTVKKIGLSVTHH